MLKNFKDYGAATLHTVDEDELNLDRAIVKEIDSSHKTGGLHFISVTGARHENLAYPRGQKMLRIATQVLKLT